MWGKCCVRSFIVSVNEAVPSEHKALCSANTQNPRCTFNARHYSYVYRNHGIFFRSLNEFILFIASLVMNSLSDICWRDAAAASVYVYYLGLKTFL